jgi:hypothetical protein
VTGIWPFSTNIFIGEGFLPSAVPHLHFKILKNPEISGLSYSQAFNLNLDISSQRSTSGHSSTKSNLYHASPVENRPVHKAAACTGTRRRKRRAGALLTDTPAKVALEAEAEACAKTAIQRQRRQVKKI